MQKFKENLGNIIIQRLKGIQENMNKWTDDKVR